MAKKSARRTMIGKDAETPKAQRPIGKKASAPAAGWTAETIAYISDVATRRRAQKVKLGDLIQSRKSLEEQLKEEGPNHTKRRAELCTDYVDVLDRIAGAREKLRELADKLEKAIDDANQGKLPGMADTDPGTAPKTESRLYNDATGHRGKRGAEKDSEGNASSRSAGTSGQGETGDGGAGDRGSSEDEKPSLAIAGIGA